MPRYNSSVDDEPSQAADVQYVCDLRPTLLLLLQVPGDLVAY
jgi:hypothetical protein